jgi:hypothetical protein
MSGPPTGPVRRAGGGVPGRLDPVPGQLDGSSVPRASPRPHRPLLSAGERVFRPADDRDVRGESARGWLVRWTEHTWATAMWGAVNSHTRGRWSNLGPMAEVQRIRGSRSDCVPPRRRIFGYVRSGRLDASEGNQPELVSSSSAAVPGCLRTSTTVRGLRYGGWHAGTRCRRFESHRFVGTGLPLVAGLD